MLIALRGQIELGEIGSDRMSWKKVLVASIVFIIFMAAVLPRVAAYSKEAIGVSESPDMSFGNNEMDLYELAEAYGESGRRIYIILRWTFDLIWPLVYGAFLFFWIAKLSELNRLKGIVSKVYLIPVIGMVLDYLENMGASLVMGLYPKQIPAAVLLVPYITLLKWGTLGVAFIVLFILLILWPINRQRSI